MANERFRGGHPPTDDPLVSAWMQRGVVILAQRGVTDTRHALAILADLRLLHNHCFGRGEYERKRGEIKSVPDDGTE